MTGASRSAWPLPPVADTVGILGRCPCAIATLRRDDRARWPAVLARRGRTCEDAEPAAYRSLHGR